MWYLYVYRLNYNQHHYHFTHRSTKKTNEVTFLISIETVSSLL